MPSERCVSGTSPFHQARINAAIKKSLLHNKEIRRSIEPLLKSDS